jgi:hypothetical protein
MKYISKTLLDRLHAETEVQLSKTISEWQQIPAGSFTSQPGPGRWSAIQCLEHLNSYGRFYLPAMEKAMNSNRDQQPSTEFRSGIFGNYFYKLMLTGETGIPKTKMKAPKEHRPAENLDTAEVLSEFITRTTHPACTYQGPEQGKGTHLYFQVHKA